MMIYLVIFCSTSLVLFASPVDFRNHHFGINPGVSVEFSRDEKASPLMYKGRDFPFQVFYSYEGSKNRHHLDLIYKHYEPISSVGNKADFFRGELRYSYLNLNRKIYHDKVNIYTGIVWSNSFFARWYNYYSFVKEGPFGELYSSFSPSFFGEHKLSESKRIIYKISSPIFAYAIRSGYSFSEPNGIIDKDHSTITDMDILKSGTFLTVNKFRGLTALVTYQEAVSNHLTFSVGYKFNYYQYPSGLLNLSANHQVYFSLSWMI